MRFAPALVASALALEASAFLVPLEISHAAEQAKSELAALLAPTSHTVDLDCPGCPYFGVEDKTHPASDVESRIHLEFSIDPEQGLTINDLPVFSGDSNNAAIPFVVSAPQIGVEDGEQTEPVQLDFAWERLPPVTSPDEPDRSIHPIRFTILGLHGYPVKVDTVAIELLQTPGQTFIGRIYNIPFEETPGATTCDTTSKWSLCRLRAIIAARLQTIMEAAKTRTSGSRGWAKSKGCGHGKPSGGKAMGHHGAHGHGMGGHHGHHHRFHRFHRLGHMLHQTLRFFVIPALLGIIGGLVASAVGMLVGQLISYLWIRVHRRGRRGTENIRAVEIVIHEDEKDALILVDTSEDDVSPPPEYRDIEANVTVEKQ